MLRVSFIIPSYNSHKTIEKTLNSVLSQSSQGVQTEILVIDSSDDVFTRDLFQSFNSSRIEFVLLNEKTSPAIGRNIGAKNANGDLLCFIDSDVYLNSDWLDQVVLAYQKGCKAGCGSVSIPPYQKDSHIALAQLYLQFNESLNVGDLRPVDMVPACNMFVEKALFDKAGGFPNIRASEDVLLCLNIGQTDKVWFVPQAQCFHMFREDRAAYFRNQMVLGKYIIIYRRKMYDKWFYKGAWPLLLLPIFLAIKSTRIKLRIFKAGKQHVLKYISCLPLYTAGMFYWAAGFAEGCMDRDAK